MSSFNMCSLCLRALRHSIRVEASQASKSQASRQRYLSRGSSRLQQQPAAQKSSEKSAPVLFVPPITTSTITANITATDPQALESANETQPPANNVPSKDEARAAAATANVSQMQKQILSNLGRKDDLTTRIAKGLRKTAKSTTESYITYGQTEAIFKSCASQADYTIPEDQRMQILSGKGPPKAADGADLGQPVSKSWWYDTIGLPPTFATWSQVTFLHMYIITVRLRNLETAAAFRDYQRYLIEHFSHAAEDKMLILHGMSARGIRNRYLKDLFLQWRGILAAYDEGLINGDAVLAGAIWRNLFRGDENVDWEKVARIVDFVRRGVRRFGTLDLQDVITKADGPSGLWASSQGELK